MILNSRLLKKGVHSLYLVGLLRLLCIVPLCAQKAVSTSQKNLDVLYERYNFASAKKNYTQAKAALDGIIALRPDDVNAHRQRCVLS